MELGFFVVREAPTAPNAYDPDHGHLSDRAQIAKAVNATVITLDEAPKGYEDFDSGAAKKYVLNPNDLIPA